MRKQMKSLLGLSLTAAMALGLVACGSGSSSKSNGTSTTTKSSKEGSVLNIEVWNDEFINRVTDHYPGYKKVSATKGKIGDVTVNWIVTPNQDNAYQNNLDKVLPSNADASADKKVDIFLVEADYALKYIDADANVAMKLSDLGIKDSDLADQYKYTKDVVTDANGDIRGASWQACSAGLIYNRDAAKEVLGTDDPTKVQESVKDWASFNATADKMKAAGYKITSSANDTYRVYSNNVSGPWVKDGKVVVDPNVKAWVDDSKKLVDAGETGTADMWSDDWAKGFYPAGTSFVNNKGADNEANLTGEKVFGYFGPAWLINFSMHSDDPASLAAQGKWGLVNGPQGFYWGGTWICAANGTDNKTLVKDIILKMTTDQDILTDIAKKDSDCVNSKTVLKTLASDTSFGNKILGGQNPYQMLADGAEKVDMSNISIYDQGCNEEFQKAMKNYFEGNASYDDAIKLFDKAVVEKYPDLKTE
jgi:ABC-type glycerol-3-phosphate transport system substrate-binding protein